MAASLPVALHGKSHGSRLRKPLAYPLDFGETIFCLATVIGDFSGSGLTPGLEVSSDRSRSPHWLSGYVELAVLHVDVYGAEYVAID